jgi:hypothetical protein
LTRVPNNEGLYAEKVKKGRSHTYLRFPWRRL